MKTEGTQRQVTAPDGDPSTVRPVEFLDTNTIARYLVQEHPELTARAAALIDSERSLRISVIVLAEVGYLLTKFYRIERARTVQALIDLLNRENIVPHEIGTELAIQALRLCEPSGRVSFADALTWAVARLAAPARVWSFDTRFPTEGIEVREP